MNETLDQLNDILIDVFGHCDIPDNWSLGLGSVKGWDSIGHLELIYHLESIVDRKIPSHISVTLTSIAGIMSFLKTQKGFEVENSIVSGSQETKQNFCTILSQSLPEINIFPDDTVLVHPRIAGLFRSRYDASLLVDDLINYFSPDGTLIVPIFSDIFVRSGYLNWRKSPSKVGVFSELCRLDRRFKIVGHPFHRFAIYGSSSNNFRHTCRSSFGVGSTLDRATSNAGKILWLNSSLEVFTFFRLIEESCQVPYRFYKAFSGIVQDKRTKRYETWSMYSRQLKPKTATIDIPEIWNYLERHDKINRTSNSGLMFRSLDMIQTHEVLSAALTKDPNAFLIMTDRPGAAHYFSVSDLDKLI